MTAVLPYEEPGSLLPYGNAATVVFPARGCSATIIVKLLDTRVRFEVGESLRVSFRSSGDEARVMRTLAIEDPAGPLLFAASNGASPGAFDSDLFQGLQLAADVAPPCSSGGMEVLGASLGGTAGDCVVPPMGSACCALLGGAFDVRLRGLHLGTAPGEISTGDLSLAAADRVQPFDGGAGSVCP